jgi:hypothetical protein
MNYNEKLNIKKNLIWNWNRIQSEDNNEFLKDHYYEMKLKKGNREIKQDDIDNTKLIISYTPEDNNQKSQIHVQMKYWSKKRKLT